MPELTTEQMIAWIDDANYAQLLQTNRFCASDSPWIQGEVGVHLLATMAKRRRELSPAEQTSASRLVGWAP